VQYRQTIIRRDPWDVEPRLKELGLTSKGLRRVRDVACAARANATYFHAANAAGTFSYQDGVWSLRNEFVSELWTLERPGGVEAIYSFRYRIRVAYANVDLCCDDNHSPLPVSEKGLGAERLCKQNLFDKLPNFAKEQTSLGIPLFYCMVDPDGRIELSRPTIIDRSFGPCVERNYISNGGDEDGTKIIGDESDNSAVDIAPQITRKAG
jgi:hypothetical protein